ncbi:MAG TPA: hypothetical protein VG844_01620 [Terracidiphilus sp.]|nr:hypothetical protein [Terracidiphilus sp.]
MKIFRHAGLCILVGLCFSIAPACVRAARSADSAGQAQQQAVPLYTGQSIDHLTKIIPALDGIAPAPSQDKLSSILDSMAGAIGSLLPRLPDLISHEQIFRTENKPGPAAPQQILSLTRPGTGPLDLTTITKQTAHGEEFRYLMLVHRAPGGAVSLEESRTDMKGHALKHKGKSAVFASGFAYQWVLFASANQSEFQFRYLGDQDVNGRRTFVLAFAQVPSQVRYPAVFVAGDQRAQYYYQGILWVDQSSFNIVHLRSDIETPLDEPYLRQLTTDIRFRSVNIPGLDQSFWLPADVELLIDQGTLIIHEQHHYTDYHLYHSTARIIP